MLNIYIKKKKTWSWENDVPSMSNKRKKEVQEQEIYLFIFICMPPLILILSYIVMWFMLCEYANLECPCFTPIIMAPCFVVFR